MHRKKKAGVLVVMLLLLISVTAFYAGLEANEFLGCQVVSEEKFQSIICNKHKTDAASLGELQINGVAAPFDGHTGRWYIPQSLTTEEWSGKLSFSGMDMQLVIKDEAGKLDKADAIRSNIPVEFVAYNSHYYTVGTLVFSGLPVLSLRTEEIADDFVYGTVGIFEPEREGQDYYSASETRMGYRVRGGFGRNYEKKGYRLKLVDSNNRKKAASLMGLREDDDWILNALYTDQNRLRDKLSVDLWNEIDPLAGTRMEYVELFINDSYEGIYGLMEPIDYKQLGLDKKEDYLYKIRDWGVPTAEDMDSCQNQAICLSVEVKNADRTITKELWEPFKQYSNQMFYGTDEEFAKALQADDFYENVIDVGLFIEMICGVDNQYKNQYISAVEEEGEYQFKKIPWDFDLSWGNAFSAESNLFREFAMANADKEVLDENFQRMLETGNCSEDITTRWEELRETVFTEENISGKILTYSDLLKDSGAYQRERTRWPDAEVSDDISDITEFAGRRLSILDGRYGRK